MSHELQQGREPSIDFLAFLDRPTRRRRLVSYLLENYKFLMKAGLQTAFMSAALHGPNATFANSTHIFRSPTFISRLYNLVRLLVLIKKIDDIVDAMPVEERQSLGEATPGNKPSAFIQNPKLDPQDYFKLIQNLDEQGVISSEESYSFSNIYARLLANRTTFETEWKKDHDPSLREKITDSNLRLSQVMAAHIMQHFIPSKEVREASKKGILTENMLEEHHPSPYRLARQCAFCDDLDDLLIDLILEVETGIAVPNWIISRLDQRGALYQDNGKINPAFCQIATKHKDAQRVVPFDVLPSEALEIIAAGERELVSHLATFPATQRVPMQLFWNKIIDSGMRPLQSL